MNNETTVATVGTVIRALITVVGGGAIFSTDQLSQIAGAAAVLLVCVWGAWKNHSNTKAKSAAVTTAVRQVQVAPETAEDVIAAAQNGKL